MRRQHGVDGGFEGIEIVLMDAPNADDAVLHVPGATRCELVQLEHRNLVLLDAGAEGRVVVQSLAKNQAGLKAGIVDDDPPDAGEV